MITITLGWTGGGVLFAQAPEAPASGAIRFATFNTSLNRPETGRLAADLSTSDDAQARAVAQIIQRVRPDVILLNEFDYDEAGGALRHFQENYLGVGQDDAEAINYEFMFIAPVNTGVASGHDLNNDGSVGGANDAFGFGQFPGQYGMALLSRFPIVEEQVRTFLMVRWSDMPGALLPDDPDSPEPNDWYGAEELEVVRLSSKSHWDVAIDVGGGEIIHALISHPTPPVFDGPEDRNGKRNHDEIRFWSDYLTPSDSEWIVDDAGNAGGIDQGQFSALSLRDSDTGQRPVPPDETHFVILGDLNSDPHDGGSIAGAIVGLLEHPRVNGDDPPTSPGGAEQARLQGGANESHEGDPAHDTADFNDRSRGPGNMRTDYALPSRSLTLMGSGVFWPAADDPLFALVGTFPFPSSDHRLVWVDVAPAEPD